MRINSINTQSRKQNFGMALKRPFSAKVSEFIMDRVPPCDMKELTQAIEEVASAQRKNKLFDVFVDIKPIHYASSGKQDVFVASVVNRKTGRALEVYDSNDRGSIADALKTASKDATLRNALAKKR